MARKDWSPTQLRAAEKLRAQLAHSKADSPRPRDAGDDWPADWKWSDDDVLEFKKGKK